MLEYFATSLLVPPDDLVHLLTNGKFYAPLLSGDLPREEGYDVYSNTYCLSNGRILYPVSIRYQPGLHILTKQGQYYQRDVLIDFSLREILALPLWYV